MYTGAISDVCCVIKEKGGYHEIGKQTRSAAGGISMQLLALSASDICAYTKGQHQNPPEAYQCETGNDCAVIIRCK